MPTNTSQLIQSKVSDFAKDPQSQANNIKSLKGYAGVVRLRVGSWRVLINNGIVVEVIKIAPRGSAYKD